MCHEAGEALDDVVHRAANLGQVIVIPAVRELGRPRPEDLHRRMQTDGDDVGRQRRDAWLEQIRQKLVRLCELAVTTIQPLPDALPDAVTVSSNAHLQYSPQIHAAAQSTSGHPPSSEALCTNESSLRSLTMTCTA